MENETKIENSLKEFRFECLDLNDTFPVPNNYSNRGPPVLRISI